jgi:hypothetical protein
MMYDVIFIRRSLSMTGALQRVPSTGSMHVPISS